SAVIDFGRDQTNFEFQAPVDLTQANYRTLLLGMKQNTKYYVRITAQGGGKTYVSNVQAVTTGYLPNGIPVFTEDDRLRLRQGRSPGLGPRPHQHHGEQLLARAHVLRRPVYVRR